MPLFYQHNINESAKIGIWKIEEKEEFFSGVGAAREITHPHKRLQHLAGRHLLSVLYSDFPVNEIQIAANRKPFLAGRQYHFSISHCGDYAAAIVSSDKEVGIDVEIPRQKIDSVLHKFLSGVELNNLYELDCPDLRYVTMLWAAKEAVYKWYGRSGLVLNRHIKLHISELPEQLQAYSLTAILFTETIAKPLKVQVTLFDDFVMAFVVANRHPE